MSNKTKIEWTATTWNPVTGCTKVSPGCKNCYAERIFPRQGKKQGRKFTDVKFHPDRLEQPLQRKQATSIFVNSMSDVGHPLVDDIDLSRIWAVMAATPQHTYQVLTKRPERLQAFLDDEEALRRITEYTLDYRVRFNNPTLTDKVNSVTLHWPLNNVWVGVSAETQETADARIPLLLDTMAAVRFVSAEPLLEGLALHRYLRCPACGYTTADKHQRKDHFGCHNHRPSLDWIIVGGESGPKARPMEERWARNLRDQCSETHSAFFMKQMSRKAEIPADLLIRQYPGGQHGQD